MRVCSIINVHKDRMRTYCRQLKASNCLSAHRLKQHGSYLRILSLFSGLSLASQDGLIDDLRDIQIPIMKVHKCKFKLKYVLYGVMRLILAGIKMFEPRNSPYSQWYLNRPQVDKELFLYIQLLNRGMEDIERLYCTRFRELRCEIDLRIESKDLSNFLSKRKLITTFFADYSDRRDSLTAMFQLYFQYLTQVLQNSSERSSSSTKLRRTSRQLQQMSQTGRYLDVQIRISIDPHRSRKRAVFIQILKPIELPQDQRIIKDIIHRFENKIGLDVLGIPGSRELRELESQTFTMDHFKTICVVLEDVYESLWWAVESLNQQGLQTEFRLAKTGHNVQYFNQNAPESSFYHFVQKQWIKEYKCMTSISRWKYLNSLQVYNDFKKELSQYEFTVQKLEERKTAQIYIPTEKRWQCFNQLHYIKFAIKYIQVKRYQQLLVDHNCEKKYPQLMSLIKINIGKDHCEINQVVVSAIKNNLHLILEQINGLKYQESQFFNWANLTNRMLEISHYLRRTLPGLLQVNVQAHLELEDMFISRFTSKLLDYCIFVLSETKISCDLSEYLPSAFKEKQEPLLVKYLLQQQTYVVAKKDRRITRQEEILGHKQHIVRHERILQILAGQLRDFLRQIGDKHPILSKRQILLFLSLFYDIRQLGENRSLTRSVETYKGALQVIERAISRFLTRQYRQQKFLIAGKIRQGQHKGFSIYQMRQKLRLLLCHNADDEEFQRELLNLISNFNFHKDIDPRQDNGLAVFGLLNE